MGDFLRFKRGVIAIKEEVVEGTPETLASGDCLDVLEASFNPNFDLIERQPFRPTFSQAPSVTGKRTATITFRTEVRGSGTAGTPPQIHTALEGCIMANTNVPATSDTYAPISTGDKTFTVGFFMDGKLYRVAGAKGTFSIAGEVGNYAEIEFEFTGVEDDISDTATPAFTPNDTLPAPLLGTAMEFIGVSDLCVTSMSLDMANNIVPRECMNKDSGHAGTAMVGRRPVGQIVVEEVLEATHSYWNDWKVGTEGEWTFVIGSVAGNIATVTAPKVRITAIALNDADGIAKLTIDFEINQDTAGDDELEIEFT